MYVEKLAQFIEEKLSLREAFVDLDNEVERHFIQFRKTSTKVVLHEVETLAWLDKVHKKEYLQALLLAVCESETDRRFVVEHQIAYSALLSYLAQQYQVEEVVLLLVTMLLAGCDAHYYQEGYVFLRFQERSDGLYGYLNPLKVNPLEVSPSEQQRFYQAVTYWCLFGLSFYERECCDGTTI